MDHGVLCSGTVIGRRSPPVGIRAGAESDRRPARPSYHRPAYVSLLGDAFVAGGFGADRPPPPPPGGLPPPPPPPPPAPPGSPPLAPACAICISCSCASCDQGGGCSSLSSM